MDGLYSVGQEQNRKTSGYIQHDRDRYGVECDTIVHFLDDQYGLGQAKPGSKKEVEAIDTMIRKNKT